MKQPESDLPWDEIEASHIFYVQDGERFLDTASFKDCDYMVHACNSYPALIAYMQGQVEALGPNCGAAQVLRGLGEKIG